MSSQPIVANLLHAMQLVAKHPRKDLRPDKPVQETNTEHGPASDSMCPIREALVWLCGGWWVDEGHDEKEDVDGAVEERGDLGLEPNTGPVRVREEAEVDDAEGDDGVDDG